MKTPIVLALAALATPPLHGQEVMPAPASACPAMPVAPPAGMAGWRSRAAITASSAADGGKTATISPGKGADVTLLPTPEVRYPVAPARTGDGASHGGLLAFTISEAGTYRVALGSAAWIEVVRDGKALASIAHQHGPACTGIRKMVDFTLAPGHHVLEIAGNATDRLAVLVARLP